MTSENFVIMLRPAPEYGTEGSDEKVSEHFDYLKSLKTKGNLIMAGRFSEVLVGLVILEAKGKDEALEIMRNDPAVKAGVFHAELYPWTIALSSFDSA